MAHEAGGGRGRPYELLSCWLLEVERERVFEALWESERWPDWWPGVVEATEIARGGPDGVGRKGRYEWRSTIPYPVRFEVRSTEVSRPWLLAGQASGDLVGEGTWRMFQQGPLCAITYRWSVRPTKPWMRALGPLLRPVFVWNHDRVMAGGAAGLAEWLECPLVAAD
ncbi:MAG: SRPBCC family protein [Solirubrobacterales bacterium]